MLRKACAGHVTGGTCYGTNNSAYTVTSSGRVNEAEAQTVHRIFHDYAAGGLRKLAVTLTAESVPGPLPRRARTALGWSPSAILAMLERELCRGVVV